MDEERMRQLVAGARVGRLASIRPDGTPHVVPVVFAVEGDLIFSAVDAKPKRSPELQRLENIRANPSVELVIDHYEDDWNALWWVRISGSARVVEEGRERDQGVRLLRARYPQYEHHPRLGVAVVIEARRWRGWSAR